MYATVNKFKVKSGREDEAKAIALEILESLKSSKGFISAVICSDEETNVWSRTIVWETRENQNAYFTAIPPERQEATRELVDERLERKGYDVVGYITAD